MIVQTYFAVKRLFIPQLDADILSIYTNISKRGDDALSDYIFSFPVVLSKEAPASA